MFLQFKVSERMERDTAREWGVFNTAYYRFKLHSQRHSDQHQMLVDLEKDGNEVYYAAPMFNKAPELNEAFKARNVIDRTVFFSPVDLGPLPDNGEHCIAFFAHSGFGYFCSEPRRIKIAAFGRSVRESINRKKPAPRKLIHSDFELSQLAHQMEGIIRERQFELPVGPADAPAEYVDFTADLTPRERIAYLSKTFFDAEFLLVRR